MLKVYREGEKHKRVMEIGENGSGLHPRVPNGINAEL